MVRFFMNIILGGASNKREGALFAFLIAIAWGTFVIVKTANGVDMSAVTGLVSTFAAASLAAFAGTAALHHMNPPGKDPLGDDPEWNPDEKE